MKHCVYDFFDTSSDKSLESQNVKNNAQVMVLILSQSSAEIQHQQNEEDERKASVSRTRQAAEALSNRKDSKCVWCHFYIKIYIVRKIFIRRSQGEA